MNAKEGLFRQNNSLSNEWYPTKKRLQCDKLKRPDSPKNDGGIGRPCLPIPSHLIKLQRISDEEPSSRATITVHDAVLAGHVGTAPRQLSPIGGRAESLIAGHRAPARGRLGVIERQV